MRRMGMVYVTERVARGELTKATGDRTWYTIADFAEAFGNRPLSQLSPKFVNRWLASHPEWKASTRVTNYGRIKAFCQWLHERGMVPKDPVAGVRAPKRPRKNPRPMSRRDYEVLRLVLPHSRAQLTVGLMYWAGLRCVEISRLNVEDVDRHGKTLHVVGKGGHERVIPFVPQVELLLNLYLREFPATSGPLVRSFTNPYAGIQAATISIDVRGWMELAGLHHAFDGRTPHAWRHACATEIAEATHDPYAVQEMLGHADISTSMYYVKRASTDRLREALELREAMFI